MGEMIAKTDILFSIDNNRHRCCNHSNLPDLLHKRLGGLSLVAVAGHSLLEYIVALRVCSLQPW